VPFFMQATFPEMFVYTGDGIDVPWCNTNRLSQLPTFWPRVPPERVSAWAEASSSGDSISEVAG
jgi:hypothetical protein